jgi:hypothetical protein
MSVLSLSLSLGLYVSFSVDQTHEVWESGELQVQQHLPIGLPLARGRESES